MASFDLAIKLLGARRQQSVSDAILLQSFGKKHQLGIKYDWYDPNTHVQSSDLKKDTKLSAADLKYNTLGFGYIFYMNENLKWVFWYDIIKNEKTLRWVQIASGTLMTLVQSASLFAGKPTSYYAVFSGFEIAATSYITIDAIRWKPKSITSE